MTSTTIDIQSYSLQNICRKIVAFDGKSYDEAVLECASLYGEDFDIFIENASQLFLKSILASEDFILKSIDTQCYMHKDDFGEDYRLDLCFWPSRFYSYSEEGWNIINNVSLVEDAARVLMRINNYPGIAISTTGIFIKFFTIANFLDADIMKMIMAKYKNFNSQHSFDRKFYF